MRTVRLFAYVNRYLILRAYIPRECINKEKVEYDGKDAYDEGKEIKAFRARVRGGRGDSQREAEYRYGKLIDEHLYDII